MIFSPVEVVASAAPQFLWSETWRALPPLLDDVSMTTSEQGFCPLGLPRVVGGHAHGQAHGAVDLVVILELLLARLLLRTLLKHSVSSVDLFHIYYLLNFSIHTFD